MKKSVTCQYCVHFQHGKIRRRVVGMQKDEKVVALRVCRPTGEIRGANDSACGQFEKADRFWCVSLGRWMEPVVCLRHRQVRKKGCVTCRQGIDVSKLITRRKNNGGKTQNKSQR